MGDVFPTIKAAAVQASSVFLDREASTEKACRLIREAGSKGANLIVFPESFIPGHPVWFHLHPATNELSVRLSTELFKNSITVPGPEVDQLAKAAGDANAYVIVGVCEKLPGTMGTMYNSQLFFSPDGEYIGKHQKLMPTVGERLVHTGGHGDTLRTFDTNFGPISGLICGENSNPLAVFAMAAGNTRVHAMSWPNFFPTSGRPLGERISVDAKGFAQMSKAFVVSASGTVDERMIEMMATTPEIEKFLRNPDICGGSVIVAPDLEVIAGPLGNEEGILYADLDLERGVRMKLRHDFVGHYNRPDVFQLTVNRNAPRLYVEAETPMALSAEIEPQKITAADIPLSLPAPSRAKATKKPRPGRRGPSAKRAVKKKGRRG